MQKYRPLINAISKSKPTNVITWNATSSHNLNYLCKFTVKHKYKLVDNNSLLKNNNQKAGGIHSLRGFIANPSFTNYRLLIFITV